MQGHTHTLDMSQDRMHVEVRGTLLGISSLCTEWALGVELGSSVLAPVQQSHRDGSCPSVCKNKPTIVFLSFHSSETSQLIEELFVGCLVLFPLTSISIFQYFPLTTYHQLTPKTKGQVKSEPAGHGKLFKSMTEFKAVFLFTNP